MLDLLITGGLVIDGSGSPGYHGAVGIEGERIRLFRGVLDGVEARRTLDATGRVVAPGFIDMHAHSGLVILAEPRHEPKVRQGVTTEVIGIDGCSYAPFQSPDDLRRFIEVKGRAQTGAIVITGPELDKLRQLGPRAWLYIVTCCKVERPRLRIIQDPVPKLNPAMLYRQVQYMVEEADWARQGEDAHLPVDGGMR